MFQTGFMTSAMQILAVIMLVEVARKVIKINCLSIANLCNTVIGYLVIWLKGEILKGVIN